MRVLISLREVPFGHTLCRLGIHRTRSCGRSVICAQKPRVRLETISSGVALSLSPAFRWSMMFLLILLASLTCPRLLVLRSCFLIGDDTSNSQCSSPSKFSSMARVYEFRRAISKKETSRNTACASPMFQRYRSRASLSFPSATSRYLLYLGADSHDSMFARSIFGASAIGAFR